MLSIIRSFKHSVDFNLFDILSNKGLNIVSGSAFTQARYKIKAELFKELNSPLKEFFLKSNRVLWKGHALISADGSTVKLPNSKDTIEHFGVHSVNKLGVSICKARMFLFYDVLNDFALDAHLNKWSEGELTSFAKNLPQLENDDDPILILDRLYGNFLSVKRLTDNERKFCIRLAVNGSCFAKSAMQADQDDFVCWWEPTPTEKLNATKHGFDHQKVKVRVVRFKTSQGKVQLLVTNLLSTDQYQWNDITDLYWFRWGIEEGFKKLKPKMYIEKFGTKKAQGVFQEFHAHIVVLNLVAIMKSEADEVIETSTVGRMYPYKANWQHAFQIISRELVQLFTGKTVKKLINRLIEEIARMKIPIKKGRSFHRDMRSRRLKSRINFQYKCP